MLIEGPVAYRCTVSSLDSEQEPQGLEELCVFLGLYVGSVMGVRLINKWTEENKGKTMIHKMSVDDVAYCIFVLVNHEDKWEREILRKASEPSEQAKYENYMTIEDDEERTKYAPKSSRFSGGAGVKRKFGSSITCWRGHALFDEIKKNWSDGLSDKETWRWLSKGWGEWVESSGFLSHWKKKSEDRRGAIGDKGDEDLLDENAGMMLLPGDDGFVDIRAEAWIEGSDKEYTEREAGENDGGRGGEGEGDHEEDDGGGEDGGILECRGRRNQSGGGGSKRRRGS